MSEAEKCPDCGRPKASVDTDSTEFYEQLDGSHCHAERVGHESAIAADDCWATAVPSIKSKLAALQSERDLLATEVEAWRALAAWESEPGARVVSWEARRPDKSDDFWVSSCDENDESQQSVQATVQAAAIGLAQKLGLLPAPKEST